MLKELVNEFMNKFNGDAGKKYLLNENFNEKSLQHNLGEFLKNKLGNDYIVQYERNINYFNVFRGKDLDKQEVDICVLRKTNDGVYIDYVPYGVIEIKYIKQYTQGFVKTASPTKTLIECLKDITFSEEIKGYGVKETISLIVSDYSFNKPSNCHFLELWNLFNPDNQPIECNKEYVDKLNDALSSSRDNSINGIKISLANTYMFNWTDLGSFKDEEGHDLSLQYMVHHLH